MTYRESLVNLLKPLSPKLGVEVGVHRGALSETLLKALPSLRLLMVDPYTPHWQYPEQEQFRREAYQRTRNLNAIYLYLSSVDAAANVNGGFDFVFIDADHSYEAVRDDLNAWWPHVRSGGLFCGHDYHKDDIPGVTQAVDEWAAATGVQVFANDGNIWSVLK